MTDPPTGVVHIIPSEGGGYHWHLKGRNGEIVASSGSESFKHPTDARSAAENALRIAKSPAFQVVYREDTDGE